MATVIFRRCVQLFLVLLGISTIIFFLQRLIPGSPADMVLGVDAADVDKLKWMAQYDLDKPLLLQYYIFLKNLFMGNLGFTYQAHNNVLSIIVPRMLETMKLAFSAFLFSMTLAIFFGVLGSIKAGGTLDRITTVVSLLAISAPSFIIGPILIWVFSVKLDLFPLMGSATLGSFVLPTVTLGTSLMAYTSRMIRSGIIDVLSEDYIRTAKAKGLSYPKIVLKHALRNAFLPTLTILGMQMGVLLSGAVITEQIFDWPGLGSLVVEAVQQREYNMVSGCVIVIATIYVVCNLFVDILYSVLDPRVRLS